GPCALQDPPAPMIRKIEQTANLPAKSADDTRLRTPCGAVRVRRRRLTVATRRPQPARHGIVQIVERARAPANMHVDARRAWSRRLLCCGDDMDLPTEPGEILGVARPPQPADRAIRGEMVGDDQQPALLVTRSPVWSARHHRLTLS